MGHWYREDGSPAHFEGKDGKGTTLREARKLNLYPSVTTVGQVVAKFALTNWLQEEAAMMAAQMVDEEWRERKEGDVLCGPLDRDWAREVVKASRDKTLAKADAGTGIHDVLEKYFQSLYDGKSIRQPAEKAAMCSAVHSLLVDKCGNQDWIPEQRFCCIEQGYGGKTDLNTGGFTSREWIIDFKTKDTVDEKTRGWPEQAEQLAAYAHGLGIPNARLANVFISREDPTQVVWFEHKDVMAWERFRHTLMLWQVTKKFGPYYEQLIK